MKNWIERGFLTHNDANRAANELLETYPLGEDEEFEIDCYTTSENKLRYGVTVVPRALDCHSCSDHERDG